jgi:FAS-associated factor 2
MLIHSISVSQALRENTYPFLALIVLRQNKMTVVARIEGPIGLFV